MGPTFSASVSDDACGAGRRTLSRSHLERFAAGAAAVRVERPDRGVPLLTPVRRETPALCAAPPRAAVGCSIVAVDFTQEIKELRATMDSVRGVTDLDALGATIADLEQQASAQDLWDDPDQAQQVTSALSRANAERDRVVNMDARIEDLETLVEMGQEEADQATMEEAERELATLKKDVGELEVRTLLSGEYDERAAVVTIRAGAGGVDAADFAEMLMRMYLRWAERHGYPTKVMDTSYAEEAGLKSATFEVNVPYAFGHLSVEGGTHRLVRISPFDNQGRRQTSFAAVEVIPLIESDDSIEIPENELKIDVFRSSGPGGQSVNTTDSAVRMTHLPTGIVVSMQNEKSQIQNRAAALRVLQSRLLLQRKAEEAAVKKEMAGDVKASWGDQMRSYVLNPYQMVKDLRTEFETGNPAAVFDGDIDGFIEAGIRWQIGQNRRQG
jgi:peptide chain release factor 2